MGTNLISVSNKSGQKNNKNFYLSSATISGLETSPIWNIENRCYAFKLTLISKENYILNFLLGSDYSIAEEMCSKIRRRFAQIQIFEHSPVAVIYNERGYVIAIRFKYCKTSGWYNFINNQISTLKELNIPISSLIVE